MIFVHHERRSVLTGLSDCYSCVRLAVSGLSQILFSPALALFVIMLFLQIGIF